MAGVGREATECLRGGGRAGSHIGPHGRGLGGKPQRASGAGVGREATEDLRGGDRDPGATPLTWTPVTPKSDNRPPGASMHPGLEHGVICRGDSPKGG